MIEYKQDAATKLKYLIKTVSGYAGLNFTDANYAAYLEAFADKSDKDFIQALNAAVLESPYFFPSLPLILKMHMTLEMADERKRRQEVDEKKYSQFCEAQNAAKQGQSTNTSAKKEGWLINLFEEKRAQQREAKA